MQGMFFLSWMFLSWTVLKGWRMDESHWWKLLYHAFRNHSFEIYCLSSILSSPLRPVQWSWLYLRLQSAWTCFGHDFALVSSLFTESAITICHLSFSNIYLTNYHSYMTQREGILETKKQKGNRNFVWHLVYLFLILWMRRDGIKVADWIVYKWCWPHFDLWQQTKTNVSKAVVSGCYIWEEQAVSFEISFVWKGDSSASHLRLVKCTNQHSR